MVSDVVQVLGFFFLSNLAVVGKKVGGRCGGEEGLYLVDLYFVSFSWEDPVSLNKIKMKDLFFSKNPKFSFTNRVIRGLLDNLDRFK